MIASTFEPVVQTTLYPRTQIDIYVHVLQQDGSLRAACINATTLALINAGVPLHDFVCAVSGGVHSTSPLLDLTTLEESPAAIERSDVCAVTAAAVVGEAVVAIVLADAAIEKFGGDSVQELVGNWQAFRDRTATRFTRT